MFKTRVVPFIAACIFLSTASFGQVQTPRKPAITTQVNNNVTMALQGSKHPTAQARFDVGAVDPGVRMNRVILSLSPGKEAQAELQSFLDRQQDKSSPDFHHWLTPEQFGAKYGPTPQDLQTVRTWLESQGIQVTSVAKSGLWMELSGTSAQMETAFKTQMRQYKVNGEMHIANATELSIPAALAPVVNGVVSLHNFFKRTSARQPVKVMPNGDGTYTQVSPLATSTTGVHALSPGDFGKIYDINSVYNGGVNGAGVKIGLVARSDVGLGDYSEFRNLMNLPAGSIANVLTALPDPGFDPTSGDSLEATLDAQWAGAVAPGANVQVIVSASTVTSDGVDLSSAYAVDHNLTDVLSVSFGACESALGPENTFFNSLWQQASAQGISVFVSSGDNGAAGCDNPDLNVAASNGLAVSGLASTPFDTAVGGTQFNDVGAGLFWSATNGTGLVSANGYIPETVWNESCNPATPSSSCAGQQVSIFAGSGGSSAIYAKPSWQTGFPATPDSSRDIPDVSLSAAVHDGYLICFNGGCVGSSPSFIIIGGTSASSPSFAGIMALVDQTLAGRQGLANDVLYRLSKGASASCPSNTRTNPAVPAPAGCIFNDVTTGNNSVPGQSGFNASTGFDLTTGLGSVDVANLITAWRSLGAGFPTTTTLSSSLGTSISVVHGTPVPLTVSVTNSSSPAPTGAVALLSTANSLVTPVDSVPLTISSSTTGAFSGNVSDLPGGTYSLTAHYTGDSVTAPSDSAPISVTITKELGSTRLQAFAVSSTNAPVSLSNTFAYGDKIFLEADVAATSSQGVPSGTVNYVDTSVAPPLLLTAPNLDARGESTVVVSPADNRIPTELAPGTHVLNAEYSGDASFTAGTPGAVTLTINKGNARISVGGDFIAGVPGFVSATLLSAGPIEASGTIQFLDNGVPLGSPVVITPGNPGVASLNETFPNDGSHLIAASYSGDATYNAQVSTPGTVNVVAPFAIAAPGSQSSTVTVTAGQTAIYNLLIGDESSGDPNHPNNFSGTVTFSCSGLPAGSACSFNPSSIALVPNQDFSFSVSVTTNATAALHKFPFRGLPVVFAGVLALAISLKSKRRYAWQAAVALVFALAISSCGGGGSASTPAPVVPPTQSAVVVTATSGGHSSSITVNLTITH